VRQSAFQVRISDEIGILRQVPKKAEKKLSIVYVFFIVDDVEWRGCLTLLDEMSDRLTLFA
jgi:hypothetical protein